jgi:hypothetical protein
MLTAPLQYRDMATRRLMALLGYAGLLPFYGSAAWACATALPGRGLAVTVFITYGAVILAFLGGTLWGYAVTVAPPRKYGRLVASNLVALFAVAVALAGPAWLSVLLLALGQVVLLIYERSQAGRRGWYIVLRRNLVIAVLPAHALLAFALLVYPGPVFS